MRIVAALLLVAQIAVGQAFPPPEQLTTQPLGWCACFEAADCPAGRACTDGRCDGDPHCMEATAASDCSAGTCLGCDANATTALGLAWSNPIGPPPAPVAFEAQALACDAVTTAWGRPWAYPVGYRVYLDGALGWETADDATTGVDVAGLCAPSVSVAVAAVNANSGAEGARTAPVVVDLPACSTTSSTTTSSTTTSSTSTSSTVPDLIDGDCTGDGVVDPFDVLAVIDAMLDGRAPVGCDATCDGRVDGFDVLAIIDAVLDGRVPTCG